MPVRAIIEPAIYREKRFSCACRAITISLKTPSAIGFFVDLLDFVEFVVKIAPVWHSLKFCDKIVQEIALCERFYDTILYATILFQL